MVAADGRLGGREIVFSAGRSGDDGSAAEFCWLCRLVFGGAVVWLEVGGDVSFGVKDAPDVEEVLVG